MAGCKWVEAVTYWNAKVDCKVDGMLDECRGSDAEKEKYVFVRGGGAGVVKPKGWAVRVCGALASS